MPDKDFTENEWHELKNYQCSKCPFATLDEKLIKEHARWHKRGRRRGRPITGRGNVDFKETK